MRAELSWRGRTGTVTVDGVVVATLQRALLAECAEVDVAGCPWRLASRLGQIGATDPGGRQRHAARGEGVWKRRWTLDLDGMPVRLERAGSRRWQLVDARSGGAAGEVQVRGALRQRADAHLPDGTSADVAVFVLWVADLLARRAGAAADSGAGS